MASRRWGAEEIVDSDVDTEESDDDLREQMCQTTMKKGIIFFRMQQSLY